MLRKRASLTPWLTSAWQSQSRFAVDLRLLPGHVECEKRFAVFGRYKAKSCVNLRVVCIRNLLKAMKAQVYVPAVVSL